MLMGVRFSAFPTDEQRLILSQWLGCARVIWNAKCDEHKYYSTYAAKYMPVGTYAPIDQKYSQYKDKELTPWLSKCPSQILRNSAVNWYKTMQNFLKGQCGKPQRKKKHDNLSLHLTRELFEFRRDEDGVERLYIGTKTNNIGSLECLVHHPYGIPNSIRIKKNNGKYWVSFCYEDHIDEKKLLDQQQHLKQLREYTQSQLERLVEAVDRGVVKPAQTTQHTFDFNPGQKKHLHQTNRRKKHQQKALRRGKKGSKRREKRKRRISKCYEKQANIRKDFNHKTSKALVKNAQVIIFEDLKTKQMTKRAKPKQDEETGRYLPNNAKAKSGLNRSILSVGWHQLETFTKYKAHRANKTVFKINPSYSSQECADCGHTSPDNRESQESFVCKECGHTSNADLNAACVLKKRAINTIRYSGTELSQRGVLHIPREGTGRGAYDKASSVEGVGCEASKKMIALAI